MKGRIKHYERYVHITMETDVSIKVTSHDMSLTILYTKMIDDYLSHGDLLLTVYKFIYYQ